MKNQISLFILLLSIIHFINNSAYSQTGGAAVPFLLIAPDARFSGMGETGTAIANDIHSVFWNPAGLGFLNDMEQSGKKDISYKEGSINFSRWLPQFNVDLFYLNINYGMYIKQLDGTIAITTTFMDLGEFTRTTGNGTVLGMFNSNEYAIGFSYGTILTEGLALGFQLKYIQSNLSPFFHGQSASKGISGAFDLGLLWNPEIGDNNSIIFNKKCLSLGFNMQNVGPKMTYQSESDPLPTQLRLGVALKIIEHPNHRLTLSCDASKLLVHRSSIATYSQNPTDTTKIDTNYSSVSDVLPKSLLTAWKNPGGMSWSIGIEYWLFKWFGFRDGFFYEPSLLGNRKYYTTGASFRFSYFQIDGSYIIPYEEDHPLANTFRIGIRVGG